MVRRFTVFMYDGTGRTFLRNITADHAFFRQNFEVHPSFPKPLEMTFPMDHTFVKTVNGTEYRVVMEGLYDQ